MLGNILSTIEKNSVVNEHDYTNDKGILICGDCHTPKEALLHNFLNSGKDKKVKCACKCMIEKNELEQQKAFEMQKKARIEKDKKRLISDSKYLTCTFENDDGEEKVVMDMCRRYVDKFPEMLEKGVGFVFHGGCGSGKTYTSACIVNELLDRGYLAMIDNIPNMISRMNFKSREELMNDIMMCDLVVIDDLGVERDSSFSKEKVYEIIDARYRTGKPTIFTTNLTLEDLSTLKIENTRTYDRILENCIPVKVDGQSRRKKKAEQNKVWAKNILFG